MGTFTVEIEIGDPTGARWERVEALVDTGATYSWVGREVLRQLGVTPQFRRMFVTADGREIAREMAETVVRLDGEQRTTIVIFGGEGTRALLGAYLLEGFGLAADPVNRRLVPVWGLAMGRGAGFTDVGRSA